MTLATFADLSAQIAAIRLAVDMRPADPHWRMVLSDCCEEAGDDVAASCWRWTVTANRHPVAVRTSKSRWHWEWANAYVTMTSEPPCCLPVALFGRLPFAGGMSEPISYPDAAAAWDALLAAWRACVAAGVNPLRGVAYVHDGGPAPFEGAQGPHW